ncbi:DUF2844 domain-containing protein [Glaciimonas soli]|uniref:DUF2844 domain-containing protein n=1 Tax=Glaciimonas soli TaxID=2590999 RepID=A0A843YPZ3_9BURK|nr:DUF2844 domain-containing protein [Glaciimonas soli]MQQ99537.1 DUF2844 domain-containing protein [Glaciimonas soli]
MRLTQFMASTLVACLATYTSVCYAGLGSTPAPLPSDSKTPTAQALVSTQNSTTNAATTAAPANYTVLNSTQNGTQVHQYVNQSGIVFAVSWKGPFLPDLKQLLGEQYFATLTTESLKTPKAGHPQTSVNHPDVVIFSGGHPRAFEGRAWIPSALPAGFDPAGIQ